MSRTPTVPFIPFYLTPVFRRAFFAFVFRPRLTAVDSPAFVRRRVFLRPGRAAFAGTAGGQQVSIASAMARSNSATSLQQAV